MAWLRMERKPKYKGKEPFPLSSLKILPKLLETDLLLSPSILSHGEAQVALDKSDTMCFNQPSRGVLLGLFEKSTQR